VKPNFTITFYNDFESIKVFLIKEYREAKPSVCYIRGTGRHRKRCTPVCM